jgi:nickel/cobalt transporter (NicO) family protein
VQRCAPAFGSVGGGSVVEILLISSASVAFFHALAPDHWLPFVALARSSNWKMRRLGFISTLAGIGHVASSLLLGLVGLWAGLMVHRVEGMETWRGGVAIWLLIGFGAAYALWGFKHAQHPHPHLSVQDAVKTYAKRRVWMLIAILVFGPCEPLIPLMFLAYKEGIGAVVAVATLFSVVTIVMVVGQSCLVYAGIRLFRPAWMERYAHALAGATIVLTGLGVLVLGF